MENSSQLGITTEEALKKLHNAIDDELNNCKSKEKGLVSFKHLLWESYSDSSIGSTFAWPSILLLSSCTIIYFTAYICGHFTTSIPIIIYGIVLILILVFNVALVYWNAKRTHQEIHEKTKLLCKQIKLCYNNERLIECWKSLRYYPHLYTPQSPCISLQWTYRDGKRVNIPTPLLVEGDVILLCPGHTAPAKCHNIEYMSSDHYYGNDTDSPNQLNCGELFVPSADYGSDAFTVPRLRKAVKPVKFVLLETPFIDHLKTIFVANLAKKPATTFEKQLHTIMSKYILKIIIPVVWLIIMLVGSIHYGYLESISSDNDSITWPASLTLLLLRPVMAILPLMPLTLPLTWFAFNVYGFARLLQVCESNSDSESQNVSNIQGSPGSILTGSNIGRENNKIKNKEFYLEELDIDEPAVPLMKTSFSFYDLLIKIKGLLFSKDGNLWRTANLLQVLGSITALCCVDKKGILSWPNPTVDKVFFMSSPKVQNDSNDIDMKDNKSAIKSHSHPKKDKRLNKNSLYSYSKSECIQLDITHDPHNAYGLQFDDPEWQRYLSSLKPLGLGILLNTCNQESQQEFIQFCDHVSCESLHNEAAVPVVNKRCVCELARQIGFTENAGKGYDYNYQIALFRHVRPEVIQKGKLAKSLNFPRLKMPFPNMTCAVIKDIYTNTDQLFSQGTGDLVLDACTEYWDGQDLCVLTDSDRKKILDFYHRSSLTSYCSAFAYVPLNINYDINVSFNDCYIELPPDSSHLFPSQKSLDSSLRSSEHHLHNLHIFSDPKAKSTLLSHHLSSDSLMTQEHGVLNSNRPKSSESNQSYDNYHIDLLMHQISNEVFIGMTTLQYQACSDFVQLVEQLETACIRFVHFSKENELRSRVFSEKMGLESGWNCHISLLNDENPNETNYTTNTSVHHYTSASKGSKSSLIHESQTIANYTVIRSQSAPNSVNLELSTVKFADDCDLEISDNDLSSQSDNDSQLNMESNVDADVDIDGKSSRRWSKVESNLSPSPSRLTTSTGTENSVAIAFDMSNRAKLPKGIENIRPHLEKVDNVPLLVSLFTDCNTEVTKEMIAIMQEYGEVVCVIGSSANILNVPIFLQSDASIGVEPMYPQVCITEPIKEADGFVESLPDNFICPTDLARHLITLPCSLSLLRQNAIIFYQLITEAKHYMMKMRNSFEFLFSSCLTITLAQLFSSLVFLPPLLSPGLVLWLVCVVLPILSFSLMGTKDNNEKISIATAKNLSLNKEVIYHFAIYYTIKFLPSVLISLLCFGFIISYSCESINVGVSTAGPCWMFSDVKPNGDINQDIMWSSHLIIGQTITSILLVLFLTVISAGFVHHNQLLWQRTPFSNRWWIFLSVTVFICHSIVCIVEVYVYVPNFAITKQFISALPVYIWCVSLLWPILILSVNTLAKRREIKMFLRQQRRARLEFGTKLGMNSPF